MKCPPCRTTLNEVNIEEANLNIKVDQCSNCKGVWFDAGELEAIQRENLWISLYNLMKKMS